jgi:propane 2-monooxygenase small subunit
VAANLAFEPLVAELFRSGFVMTAAAAHGDFITPNLVAVAESDLERDLAYTKDLISGLTSDEKYGEENKKLFTGWLSEPVEMCTAAARSLEELWNQAEHTPVSFEQAFNAARERVRELLDELEISTPKELDR